MGKPAGSFIWYELMSPDPDASAHFYGAVVGWKVVSHSGPGAAVDYRMIERADGGHAGGVMGLSDEMARGGARPCWLGYLAVADVDAAVVAIEDDGGKTSLPPFDIDVGRIAMVVDPQGAPLYVMTPRPPAGEQGADSDVFSTDQAQHVRWNELRTSHPEAALSFYGKHFGIEPSGEMYMGEMGTYRFISKAGTAIGAVMQRPKEMLVSAWAFYIGVDDIDRAVQMVKASGGRILVDPMEIPGGEFALDGIDPQGAPFGLVGPRKG